MFFWIALVKLELCDIFRSLSSNDSHLIKASRGTVTWYALKSLKRHHFLCQSLWVTLV